MSGPTLPGPISDWTTLVTSEHIQAPNYNAMIAGSVQPFGDQRATSLALYTYFAVSTAVGQQLDMLGDILGVSRTLQFAAPYTMSDTEFRAWIRFAIAAEVWNGTVPGAYAIWTFLFGGVPFWIQDLGNFDFALIPTPFGGANIPLAVLLILATKPQYMQMRSGGVRCAWIADPGLTYPVFAWGMPNTSNFAGWGTGKWVKVDAEV